MTDGVDWESPEGRAVEFWINLDDARHSKVPKDKRKASLEAIQLAVKLLRAGEPNEWISDMLEGFLESIVKSGDERLATLVAGASSGRGRPPSKQRRGELAALAFKGALKGGASEEEAIKVAYDVYRGAGRYEKEIRQIVTQGGKETTRAAIVIEDTLKPLLRDQGVLPPGAPGRPKKKR